MKKYKLIIAFTAFLVFAGSGNAGLMNAQNKTEIRKTTTEVYYTCSMHPEIHSLKPGKCPKCGMELVKAPIKNKPAKCDSTKTKHADCCM